MGRNEWYLWYREYRVYGVRGGFAFDLAGWYLESVAARALWYQLLVGAYSDVSTRVARIIQAVSTVVLLGAYTLRMIVLLLRATTAIHATRTCAAIQEYLRSYQETLRK